MEEAFLEEVLEVLEEAFLEEVLEEAFLEVPYPPLVHLSAASTWTNE